MIGHLIPLTVPCGFGKTEKNTTHIISPIYKTIAALVASLSGSSGNLWEMIPKQAMHTILFSICTENCRCSTLGYFVHRLASSVHWPCSALRHSVLPQHPATGISIHGMYSPSRSSISFTSCSLNGNTSLFCPVICVRGHTGAISQRKTFHSALWSC